MKAAVLEQAGRIECREVEVPDCDENSLLLRVDGCAVSAADLAALRGECATVQAPVIPGRQLVGTVVEVGSAVHGYYDSERVTVAPSVPCGSCFDCRCGRGTVCQNKLEVGLNVNGGFAEYLRVPATAVRSGGVHKVPDGTGTGAACLTEPLARCLSVQQAMGIGPGDAVLVVGCGAPGCLHAMLARALGAGRVSMADASARRLELAGAVRADDYFDTAQCDLAEAVPGVTADRGADAVVVTSGGPQARQQALSVVARGGRACLFAGPVDDGALSLDAARLRDMRLTLVGEPGCTALENYEALSLIAAGRLPTEEIITHQFSLQQIGEAFRAAESEEALKVLVRPHE